MVGLDAQPGPGGADTREFETQGQVRAYRGPSMQDAGEGFPGEAQPSCQLGNADVQCRKHVLEQGLSRMRRIEHDHGFILPFQW
ncbi:hypothetical protein D3C81_1917130 [compost metagenome]